MIVGAIVILVRAKWILVGAQRDPLTGERKGACTDLAKLA
jgi:hypothetical protein